jgi:hypothetical protein
MVSHRIGGQAAKQAQCLILGARRKVKAKARGRDPLQQYSVRFEFIDEPVSGPRPVKMLSCTLLGNVTNASPSSTWLNELVSLKAIACSP